MRQGVICMLIAALVLQLAGGVVAGGAEPLAMTTQETIRTVAVSGVPTALMRGARLPERMPSFHTDAACHLADSWQSWSGMVWFSSPDGEHISKPLPAGTVTEPGVYYYLGLVLEPDGLASFSDAPSVTVCGTTAAVQRLEDGRLFVCVRYGSDDGRLEGLLPETLPFRDVSRRAWYFESVAYAYRQGQKKLVTDVYRSIMREKTLFLQAPTGTGKTLATIFPAIQAMGQNMGDKIFYLTAKNATGVVAHDTFLLMEEQGYEGKTVVITAKDKMCLLEERSCNPDDCPYAKGHFDRVNDAVYDILQEENMMDRDCILRWAKDRRVCPFEYSLDIASWVDHIICDYNYVFDPNVCLKRFFAEGIRGDYLFLVDEAHNLVERARDMYSETLVKEDFLAMKKKLKIYGKKLENTLERCNKEMLVLKRQCEKLLVLEEMDSFLFALFRAAAAMDELLQKEGNIIDRDVVLDFYFKVRNFVNLSDDFDEHYRIYCDYDEKGQFCLHLFCVDPSYMLQKRLDRSRACVFFSATLLPIRYYKELLCCDDDVYAIYADSVFEQEKRALLIGRDVSSRYTRRTFAEYLAFADYIEAIVEKKKGNYMVFCPSYKMLEEISQKFMAKSLGSCDVICQRSGMSEQEREDFLKEFEEVRERSFVAFCVMGGVFSEGIDLTEEKLIGAIIVGVGLPQIGNEREVMKQYFEATGRDGFSFAYLYPGMNKVIQAAGRVIRTKSDEGVIALLDERFTKSEYRQTFPREWNDGKICDRHTVGDLVDDFWQKR